MCDKGQTVAQMQGRRWLTVWKGAFSVSMDNTFGHLTTCVCVCALNDEWQWILNWVVSQIEWSTRSWWGGGGCCLRGRRRVPMFCSLNFEPIFGFHLWMCPHWPFFDWTLLLLRLHLLLLLLSFEELGAESWSTGFFVHFSLFDNALPDCCGRYISI